MRIEYSFTSLSGGQTRKVLLNLPQIEYFFSFKFLSQSGNHFLRQLLQQTKNNFVEKSVEREQNVSNVVGGVNMRVSMIVQNILMPQYFFSRQDVRLIYFVCSSSFSRILLAAV